MNVPLPDCWGRMLLCLAFFVVAGCQVSANIDGKPCPCASGFVCVNNQCFSESNLQDRDASTPVGRDGGVVPGSLTFVDRTPEHFMAGTFDRTEWSGDSVRLVAGEREGTFTSRVFDALQEVEWTTFEWSPRAPYGKPLPNDGGQETGYTNDAVDMADNVLLVHFDSNQGVEPGATLPDGSGTGNDVTVGGSDDLTFAPGPVKQGAKSTTNNYVFARAGESFQFDTGDYTWALWVRTTQSCESFETNDSNRVHMGIEDRGEPPSSRTHLWLGCRQKCNGTAPGGQAAVLSFSPQNSTSGGVSCSTNIVNDDVWHQITYTKTGHDNATVRLYFDGALESTESVSFSPPFRVNGNEEFAIGAFSGGAFSADAEFDEAAVFLRALSDEEAGALYRRGALHLSFQIRLCDDADCANNPPFVGPDGTENSVFDDSAGSLSLDTITQITGLRGRYIQYRATLQTATDSASPEFDEVSFTAP